MQFPAAVPETCITHASAGRIEYPLYYEGTAVNKFQATRHNQYPQQCKPELLDRCCPADNGLLDVHRWATDVHHNETYSMFRVGSGEIRCLPLPLKSGTTVTANRGRKGEGSGDLSAKYHLVPQLCSPRPGGVVPWGGGGWTPSSGVSFGTKLEASGVRLYKKKSTRRLHTCAPHWPNLQPHSAWDCCGKDSRLKECPKVLCSLQHILAAFENAVLAARLSAFSFPTAPRRGRANGSARQLTYCGAVEFEEDWVVLGTVQRGGGLAFLDRVWRLVKVRYPLPQRVQDAGGGGGFFGALNSVSENFAKGNGKPLFAPPHTFPAQASTPLLALARPACHPFTGP